MQKVRIGQQVGGLPQRPRVRRRPRTASEQAVLQLAAEVLAQAMTQPNSGRTAVARG